MTAVGILGAGLSGLGMAMALRRAGLDDFVLYEKLHDVGGTWLRNTYPGLHCDIPSHLYCYSTDPNPNWSRTYAPQAEIQVYLRACAERYGLVERTRFATDVTAARFDADDGSWSLELADGTTARHRVLVSATGGLTEPYLPRIPGLDRFQGPRWHSGAWRHDVDLTGLRVAVVGSAASAVQVVPAVAETAAEVTVYSRTPNWVMPRDNAAYTAAEQEALANPEEWRRLRRRQYRDTLLWFGAFKREAAAVARLREIGLANLHAAISDPELIAALTPSFDPGCKRILVSDEYYPTLAQDHVHLVAQGVAALTETGVVAADGTETTVDVVIFCTGYRLGSRADCSPAVDVFGRDGRQLRRVLAERTEAYRGVAIPGFPNYFTICGINGTVGYTGLFQTVELDAAYVARWTARILNEDLLSVEPRADITERYNAAIQAELSQMSWTGDCPNFYRGANGQIVSFFPGSVGRLRRELDGASPEDFIVVPR